MTVDNGPSPGMMNMERMSHRKGLKTAIHMTTLLTAIVCLLSRAAAVPRPCWCDALSDKLTESRTLIGERYGKQHLGEQAARDSYYTLLLMNDS
jgi:hypothetical protein